jgi:hypothetical protein
MKASGIFTLIFIATFSSCKHRPETRTPNEGKLKKTKSIDNLNDQGEIQTLIRQTLKWADSAKSIELLPAISGSTDSVYSGFDFNVVESNLQKFERSGFFSREFINNYNQIMLTIDIGIKSKVYSAWLVGEMQTFNFANDVNPWCYCQELPYENPDPWTLVEITTINLNEERGELTWTWGQTDWPDIKYSFKVVKDNGKWKISYMKGFDYNESIKKG